MGLDMYLTADRFMSPYFAEGDDVRIDVISNQFAELGINKITTVTAQLGYWRKANAIHKWFVDNTQDGVDECQKTYLETADLQKLLDVVNEVLADNSKAKELLPPQDGFFFGNTSDDEYYFQCLADTKEILERIIGNDGLKVWSLYYHSSW